MKRLLVVSTILASAALGTASAQTGITGSSHDLTVGAGAGETTQICVYCHTPHNASATAQLWNRDDPIGPFAPYASPTLDAAVGAPSGVSLACLSCHDGATTFDSLVHQPADGTAVTGVITGNAAIGVDLSNDHPVSMSVNAGDPDIEAAATIVATLPLFGAGSDLVECASCHEPHTPNATDGFFLRSTLAGSALCKTCHLK